MTLAERLASLPPEKRRLFNQLTKGGRVERRSEERDTPLSFEQERLWFLHELEPSDSSYHLHLQLPLPQRLELPAWTKAWHLVMERHAALRTRFPLRDGFPVQIVDPVSFEEIPIFHLSQLPPNQRRYETSRIARDQAERPFNLATGPLLRLALLELPDQWVQLITVHHIVADGWSIDILMHDLNITYTSLLEKTVVCLAPLPIQFTDFARWQRSQLTGVRLENLLSFWSEYLAQMSPLQLPLDRPRPERYSPRGGVRTRVLPEQLVERLNELARSEGSTLFQVMLAAFAILLHRYSGQTDMVFGTPVANRELPEVEELVGFFLNTILLRVRVEPDHNFREVLAFVRESTISAYSHQQLPFAKLVQHFQPHRDLRQNPLYQATVQLLRSRQVQARTRAEIEDVGYERTATNTDLALDLFDSGNEMLCRVEYRLDLFDDVTIERFLDHWERVLTMIVEHPTDQVARLRLIKEEERMLLLNDFAGQPEPVALSGWSFSGETNRPAIHHEGGQLSYLELEDLVGRLASVLVQEGACQDTVIAIELSNPLETVIAILSAWRAGAAYTYLDPTLPEQRLAHIRNDIAPVVILKDHGHWRRQMADVQPLRAQPIPGNRLAAIIYTSGSTGMPKGVMIEHGALANQCEWLRTCVGLSMTDIVLQKYSFSFDAALSELLAGLATEAQLVIDGERGRDADRLLMLIRKYSITTLDTFPSQAALLKEHPDWPRCSSLRTLICGGERLSRELTDSIKESQSGVKLINAYGPTEATVTATAWFYRAGRCEPPIGRPIQGYSAYVLDPNLAPVPIGIQGELYLGGVGVAKGYWRDAVATAARFIANPFGPGRLYATGDRARFLASGDLEFRGRADSQVKLRGFRIETSEIETALNVHPAIRESAVLLKPIALVPEEDMAIWHWRLEQLSEVEAEFVHRFESGEEEIRRRTMWRNTPGFNIYLHLLSQDFVASPSATQKNWLLQRALDEITEDLQALDTTARRCVKGSSRPEINGEWSMNRAHYSPNELIVAGQQVMQAWERPLMLAMAEIAAAEHGDVAEIGFGMGISATLLQELGVRSHTIVECHENILQALEHWRQSKFPLSNINIISSRWQDWEVSDELFDAILFDTYPTNEEEYLTEVIESPTFAASFFPMASRLLRPGGVFTYYTNEIDSLARRHQRLLLNHFSSFSVRLVRGLVPPPDCQYWWADSMAVVQAVK